MPHASSPTIGAGSSRGTTAAASGLPAVVVLMAATLAITPSPQAECGDAERPGLFPELLQFERDGRRLRADPDSADDASEDLDREFLATCERRYGRTSSEAAEASFPLAERLINSGKVAEGLDLMRRAIAIRAEAHGRDAVERTCDLFLLSEFLERDKQAEEAIDLAEQGLRIHERASGVDHPDTVLFLERLAELHAGQGDERTAETFRRRARRSRAAKDPETNPDALDWPQLFRAHEHCGARLFDAGDVAAATYHFERAVSLRPELGENHNNMGTVFSAMAQEAGRRGEEEEAATRMRQAIRAFAKACRLEPGWKSIRVNYANALAAAERFDEAAEVYEDLLEQEPDNAALLTNLGVALFKTGRKREAIARFRRALAIDPDLKDARESLEYALDAER